MIKESFTTQEEALEQRATAKFAPDTKTAVVILANDASAGTRRGT